MERVMGAHSSKPNHNVDHNTDLFLNNDICKYILFFRFLEEYEKEGLAVWSLSGGNEVAMLYLLKLPRITLNCTLSLATNQAKWLKNYLKPALVASNFSQVKFLTMEDQRIFAPYWMNRVGIFRGSMKNIVFRGLWYYLFGISWSQNFTELKLEFLLYVWLTVYLYVCYPGKNTTGLITPTVASNKSASPVKVNKNGVWTFSLKLTPFFIRTPLKLVLFCVILTVIGLLIRNYKLRSTILLIMVLYKHGFHLITKRVVSIIYY